MATNKVNQFFSATGTAVITLASLPSSVAGVGQQSDEINVGGSADQPFDMTVFFKITQGASPVGDTGVYFYAIGSDGTNRGGQAGASNAGITLLPHQQPEHIANNSSTPSAGDVLQDWFTVRVTTPYVILALFHDTGDNLDASAGAHGLKYILRKPDIQAAS